MTSITIANAIRLVLRPAALLLGAALCTAHAAPVKIAFLTTDPAGTHPFWNRTIAVMEAAAEDLGVDLIVSYSKSNTYSNRKDAIAMLERTRPDYFLTGYWPGSTEHVLAKTAELGVNVIVFNSGAMGDQQADVGPPRGRYRHWLGQLTPDDRQAGYDLADALITRARAATGGKVQIVGVGGIGNSTSDLERRLGLEQRVEQDADAVLDRFLYAEWSQSVARETLTDILEPDTPVSVLWCASDAMALGALEAARAVNKKPGRDIFIGGIGGLEKTAEAVAAGDMQITLGGHFLEGAWALILAHDHHRGHDFADDLGVDFHSRYTPVTAANAKDYLATIADADWSKVDFRRFSKVHNPDLQTYRWPLDAVFAQLKAARKKGD